jgi:hypothetical protein
MPFEATDDSNYNGSSQATGNSDFTVLPDNCTVTYTIHKAVINTRKKGAVPAVRNLSLGLICCDMETGQRNYVYDDLYIDTQYFLEKDRKGQPWMQNFFLAFTNSCGLREQGARVLPDNWFSDAGVYQNLSGEAVLSKESYNGAWRNRVKFYNQRKQQAPTQQVMHDVTNQASTSGATVEQHQDPISDVPF